MTVKRTARFCRPSTRNECSDDLRVSFRALARRVRTALRTDANCCVGVTGSEVGAGASTVAAQLALELGGEATGPVLLLDADPQHASPAKSFGWRTAVGLRAVPSSGSSVTDPVQATRHSGLFVWPAGALRGTAADWSDEAGQRLLRQLKREFRFIVMDLPPATTLDEGVLAASEFDGFLLVLPAERVRRQAAERIKEHFVRAEANLLGVVLNRREYHIPEWLYHRL